jgi:hypothetical protein
LANSLSLGGFPPKLFILTFPPLSSHHGLSVPCQTLTCPSWKKQSNMFTPIQTAIGAVLLHQASSNLLYQNGNVLGASGLLRRLFTAPTKETFALFAGMAASFGPMRLFVPELLTYFPPAPDSLPSALITVAVAMLIGWGSKVNQHGQAQSKNQH